MLEEQLIRIKNLIPKIKPHEQKKLRDLPKHLQQELKTIEVIPAPTASGLEPVASILENLFLAQVNLEEIIRKRKEKTFIKPTAHKIPIQTAPSPSPAPPPQKPPAKPTPPSAAPTPQQVPEKFRKEKPLDFGPYSK